MKRLASIVAIAAAFALWEALVRFLHVSPFLLPAPSSVVAAFARDVGGLLTAMLLTLKIAWLALAAAAVTGFLLAVAFSFSKLLEGALYPLAIALQVTPVVAIAPLILVWCGLDHVVRALVIIAWIVAFFPIVANASLGLKSVDPNLRDLFRISGATRWQTFRFLALPSALPSALAGLKVSAGLALIGAVVAEFVAGAGDAPGLAYVILESGNRLEVARMFAALMLLSIMGIMQYLAFEVLERRLTRHWRQS